jgi:hypothetical protein
LKKDGAHGKVRRIRIDFEGKGEVRKGQTWCRNNRSFEGVKRRCAVVPVCVDVVVYMSSEVGEW